MWKDYVMENNSYGIDDGYRLSTQEQHDTFVKKREESKMLGELAAIAKKHGIELKWTDYSDRTPDHYNVLRGSGWSWKQWNPLEQEVDVYELLLRTGIYWLDISKPLKELCEEIIMYRGEKNV